MRNNLRIYHTIIHQIRKWLPDGVFEAEPKVVINPKVLA
jgi:hypothetical protein